MASQRVNMNGSDDPFYRYTMPPVMIKVEGTTKMIKTVLINIEEVSAACARPVDYLVTYFGQELSANSKVDSKQSKSYVTGNVKLADLQATCFKFIRGYVMCGTCQNPETIVTVTGKKKHMTVVLICKGCGAKTTLDETDRFVKYMTQHPIPLTKQEEKLYGDALKKKKSKKGAEGDGDGEGEEQTASPAVAAAAETSAEATPEESGEKKKKKKKKKVEEEDDDDEDWCMDTSAEAVKARAEAMNVEAMLEAAEKATKKALAKDKEKEKEAEASVPQVTSSIANIHVDDDEVDDIDDI